MATPRDTRWENDGRAMESSSKKRNRPGRGGAPVPERLRGRDSDRLHGRGQVTVTGCMTGCTTEGRDRLHGKGQAGNNLCLEMLFSDAI
jgi:hypothetical protein